MVPVDNSQLVPMQKKTKVSGIQQPTCSKLPMCAADEPKILCIIKDLTNPQWQQCKITVNLPANTTSKELCEEVARQANYEVGTFSLLWLRGGQDGGDDVPMNDVGEENLLDLGMLTSNKKNLFQLGDKDGEQPVPIEVGATGVTVTQDDNVSTGAVNDEDTSPVIASPTVDNQTSSDYGYGGLYASAVISKSDTGFVGLVNQAMTCYLNSLLQTLYMTPEFRIALYKWEYDEMSEDPGKSIPYQLQRLFVQLQTSKKRAVETTDVTKSFGWDSSEAWQQHDVQELCRVMFDALEKKWKNTDQANLINQLYQGQMKDYVKCLECGYESARNDAFLDIPLVIRPFGATQAYGSVEKAMRAFVTPETLDDTNQYFCEKCNKKCDAHKGLKFNKFPYLLTLQLKRFDFDYTTMHRIKLNDKMTFPEILNLNDFIEGGEKIEDGVAKGETESQTDSGAENEDSCPSNQSSESTDDGIDEGIDVEQAATALTNDRNEKQRQQTGPYTYQLFSIMVHSGTAAGGHYYAYIKSFSDGQWYCFNDQHVTCVTYDDIRKTYGGSTGSYRGYYSSSYASSTNAYMLMYRQIDHKRNKGFITTSEFPGHIQQLSQSIVQEEENEKRQREIERNTCKIKLFAVHPVTGKPMETRLEVHKDKTLAEATEIAYELLGFDKILPLNQCRLVKYDEFHESLEMSYDGEEETRMGQLLGGVKSSYMFDLMMETRQPDQQFQTYKVGGVTIKLFEVDLEAENIRNPISMRAYLNMTINDFKTQVSQITGLPLENMRVVLEKYYNDLRLLTVPNKSLKAEGFLKSNKVFVEGQDSGDQEVPFPDSRLHLLLDRYANTIRLFVSLPPALTDAASSNSDVGSGCASISSSPSDKYSDLNVDTSLLSPNKAPTPSPTGSSSTLSDDHPLDKNHMSLLGSETDSGVVSLSETRMADDQIALLGEDNNCRTPPCEGERGEPDGAPSPQRTGQGDAGSEPFEGFTDNLTLENVTNSEAVQSEHLPSLSSPTSSSPQTQGSNSTTNNVSSISTSQTVTTLPTIPSSQSVTARSSTTSDLSCPSCQLSTGSSSSCEECNRLKSPMQDTSAPASSLSLSSIDSHLTASSVTTSSETGAEHKLDGGQGEAAGLAYDDCNGDSEEEIYENTRHKQRVWYFRADPELELEGGRVLPVYLDKRMTLRAFKRAMEPYVGATMHNFKVYRVYANNQEFESFRLNETLQTYSDDGKVIIKHGRALKKGEYRVKVFQLLVNDPEPCKHLLDWVFAKGMSVLQSKKELLAELKAKCGIDIPIERLRLRKKAWKNPGAIYMDNQIYEEDIPIFTNWEVFVEILSDAEPMQSPSQLVLLTRRWRPSEFKLDQFKEVVINDGTAEELKRQISALSDIPEERVEFAKGKGTFPCEVSLLEMQTDLEWDPQVTSLNSYPLYISDDGAVIYYRDSEEDLMELSEDQKRELQKKESARLAKSGQRINYSPRKERALKIYTDNPPAYSAVAD